MKENRNMEKVLCRKRYPGNYSVTRKLLTLEGGIVFASRAVLFANKSIDQDCLASNEPLGKSY